MAIEISTPVGPAPPHVRVDLLRARENARQARLGSILTRAGNASDRRYKSDRALHLTDEGDVVEEGDARGRFLLVGTGGSIPQDLADDLHIGAKAKASDISGDPPAAPGGTEAGETDPAGAVGALPLSDAQKAAIAAAGYDSRAKLAAASDEQLRAIPGIGDASIAKIRDLYPAS